MAFFDDIGKKIAQTGQGAAQKAKNMAETVKLNSMVSDEEKRINNAFIQIGKTYYETYGNSPDQLFIQLINGINDSKAKIVSYYEQINKIKGIVRCQKCGGEVPYNSLFCSSCGSPMNTVPPAPAVQPVVNDVFCEKCGTKMSDGQVFCSNCGNRREPTFESDAVQPVDETVLETTVIETVVETVVEPQSFEPEVPQITYCSGCGMALPEDAVFCLNCGQKTGD